jgi:hypothetical protein
MSDYRLSLAFLIVIVAMAGAAAAPVAAAPLQRDEYVFVPVADMPANFDWGGRTSTSGRSTPAAPSMRERRPNRVKGNILAFPEPVKVYEFRSGRLILGTMRPGGEFVPEAGSTVRPFEDYQYGRDYVIWNLPGFFQKKAPPAGGKPEKR